MKNFESIAVILVMAGAVIMLLSIIRGMKIKSHLSDDLQRKWTVLTPLMLFFFLGYLFYIYILIANIRYPLELVTGSIFFGGACFVYIVVKLTDVSFHQLEHEMANRKKLQELIIQGKQEWEETFDIINDAITIHDSEFNVLRANKEAERILGVPFQEIIGHKCFQLYHGTECPPEECPSCLVLKSGKPSSSEIFEPHLNKYFEVKALPRFNSDNKIVGIIHVLRDITQRKRAEVERETLIHDLEDALSKIKTLKGLLPICAWCKNIRDDKGYWKNVEAYIEAHSDATFTHGICPECMEKEEDDYMSDNKG